MKTKEKKKVDETVPDVAPGDYVCIKDWVFKDVRMMPITLYHAGWPNKFQVMEKGESNGEIALRVDPCCGWMEDHRTGKPLCEGHPAKFFERLDDEPDRRPGENDRYTSFEVPWGKVLSAQYLEDPISPTLVLRFGSGRRPFAVSGLIAKELAARAREFGYL